MIKLRNINVIMLTANRIHLCKHSCAVYRIYTVEITEATFSGSIALKLEINHKV